MGACPYCRHGMCRFGGRLHPCRGRRGCGGDGRNSRPAGEGLHTGGHGRRIQAEINNALFQADHVLFGRVNLSVTEARVLPTGRVPTPEDRVEATRLTWQVQGVQEVINELQVDDSSSIVDAARDQLIAATLRQKLIFDSAVRSINYSIATVNGRIYLFGIARSADELDRVVNHGRNVKYVRDVTSYVRIAEPRTWSGLRPQGPRRGERTGCRRRRACLRRLPVRRRGWGCSRRHRRCGSCHCRARSAGRPCRPV